MFWFGEDPREWIARDGRPAAAVGYRAMPSYESADQAVLLFENLVAQRLEGGGMMFFPWQYDRVCYDAISGYVQPNPQHDALIKWRPCLFERVVGGIEGKGSQQELAHRYVRGRAIQVMGQLLDLSTEEIVPILDRLIDYRVEEACERAEALLLESLTAQQRLEYRAHRRFRVRGGRTRSLYGIHPSNGFALLDPATNDVLTSYCLHPEYWLPDADVALATKVALENPETEEDCLTRAGAGGGRLPRKFTKADEIAQELELELIK